MFEDTGGRPMSGTDNEIEGTCSTILNLLLPHRRAADGGELDSVADFPEQIRQLTDFVADRKPILFTLPAFPCKSPNRTKVLGHLPDEGERLALRFLNRLCESVEQVYAPGARMIICSDGHVFGDLIGVPDQHITAYSEELRAMMADEALDRIDTFDLRDVFGDASYDEKRALLEKGYAPSLEQLRAEVGTDEDTLGLYRGITRFLVEDTVSFTGTRSALQRDCRRRAYGVIGRSRAWGELIADHFSRSVRLSIHPQRRRARKFGIRLLEARDVWMTPWHSSVLRRADGDWQLMRRDHAERVGRIVMHGGRPSHFEAVTAAPDQPRRPGSLTETIDRASSAIR